MRKAAILIMLALLVALFVSGCGGEASAPEGEGGTSGGTGITGPVGQAETAACAANRRVITSAVQQYKSMEGKAPTSIQQLVPEYLDSVPTCPSGGTYTLSGDRVICSVHGS